VAKIIIYKGEWKFMNKKVLKKILSLAIPLVLVTIFSTSYHTFAKTSEKSSSSDSVIVNVNTDKARYNLGDKVKITIYLKNNGASAINKGTVSLYFKHLEKQIDISSTKSFTIEKGAKTTLTFTWTPPSTDYQGYLVEAYVKDSSGNIIDNMNTAIDVSSNWLRFPRYGYLTKFGSQSSETSSNIISQLNDYHINAIQYYDWQWKHHIPIKGDPSNPDASWDNLANQKTYKKTILDYINSGHESNIAAMEYNLIYGAVDGYTTDGSGVKKDWALLDSAGGTQWKMDMPSGWATSALYFFNPLNTDWQNYILNREKDVFKAFPFDGWHEDTVGDWGTKYITSGQAISITDTFKPFINYAKSQLVNKKIIFNPVGFKGHTAVAQSNADALYAELWPGDGFVTYNDIKGAIDTSRTEGNGRSLIVPAYMDYDAAKAHSESSPGYMNTPGVLLTDAATFASGGSRLELGDDNRMLCSEYFPNSNMIMSDDLKQKERRYYDFLVAYENLLRDGQNDTSNKVEIPGIYTSRTSEPNKVWTFTKSDGNHQIIHLINLLGEWNNAWRDTNADYPEPTSLSNLNVKYYYTDSVGSVSFASPDYENGKTIDLPFQKGYDAGGNYVVFKIPTLQYWDMIYINKSTVTPTTQGSFTNPGFEAGNISGWTATGTSYGVDGDDVHSGKFKCYYWNGSPYTQNIEQPIYDLANGWYKVSAWVKQSLGTPNTSRMELADYGGAPVYTNIPHGDGYQQISAIVHVNQEHLKIGFYQDAPGSTNLQIDDVTLEPIAATANSK
jgi:dextranase